MRKNFNAYQIHNKLGMFRERLVVKKFASSDAMYRFMGRENVGYSTDWKDCEYGFEFVRSAKPGTYAQAGGQWINIRNLGYMASHV